MPRASEDGGPRATVRARDSRCRFGHRPAPLESTRANDPCESPTQPPDRCRKRHDHPPASTTAPAGRDLDARPIMSPRPRTIILAAVLLAPAAALAAGCGTSDRPPAQAAEASPPTTFATPANGHRVRSHRSRAATLVPCSGGQLPSAECGSVEVPLDRANPAAGTTKVAFALLPRRDPSAPAVGTVLFNPGGPGISAIGQAAKIAGQFAPLLDRRDLLIIDPRGTGRSGALRCHALDTGAAFAPRAAFVAA